MDPYAILAAHYPPDAPLTRTLLDHSRHVADKALAVARSVPQLHPNLTFIGEAALLHDIGILHTKAPTIHCHGREPYVCHGIIGRRLLEAHGLPVHALVCERHVGTGITIADIQRQQLPLPLRDMQPQTIEETIVCYADKFFSKIVTDREHRMEEILADLARYGKEKADRFLEWHRLFGG